MHLIGDLHQPRHVCERGRDRGGNARLVFYPGRREAVSLHVVWDTLIVRDLVGKQKIVDSIMHPKDLPIVVIQIKASCCLEARLEVF